VHDLELELIIVTTVTAVLAASLRHDLNNTTSKQKSMSFILVPIDFLYALSYRLSIVTFALGRTVPTGRSHTRIFLTSRYGLQTCSHSQASVSNSLVSVNSSAQLANTRKDL